MKPPSPRSEEEEKGERGLWGVLLNHTQTKLVQMFSSFGQTQEAENRCMRMWMEGAFCLWGKKGQWPWGRGDTAPPLTWCPWGFSWHSLFQLSHRGLSLISTTECPLVSHVGPSFPPQQASAKWEGRSGQSWEGLSLPSKPQALRGEI